MQGEVTMDRCEGLQYEIAMLNQTIEDAKNFRSMAFDDVPELIVLENMPRIGAESARKETGGKVGSRKDISPSLVSKNGPSVERAAEDIVERYGPDGEGILTKDEFWVRDEIITILLNGKKNYKKEILEDVRELELKVLELEKKLKSECLGDRSFEGFFMSKQEVIKEAMEYQNTRNKRSRAIDEKSSNKRRLSPTAENLLRWMKNPSRFDIIGVDAYRAKRPTADLEIDLEVWWRGQKLPDKSKVRKKKSVEIKKPVSINKKSSSKPKKSSGPRLYKIPYSGASGDGYYVTLASGPDAAKKKFFGDMGVTDKIDGKAMPTTNNFIGNKNMIKAVKDGGFARVFPVSAQKTSKKKSEKLILPNPKKDAISVKFGGGQKAVKIPSGDYKVLNEKGTVVVDWFGQKTVDYRNYKIV